MTDRALEPAPRRSDAWLSVPERGTVLGIASVFWLATALGRGPVRAFVALLALWYVLVDAKLRAVSRAWWSIVDGRPPSLGTLYGHVRRFSNVTVDRIFLLRGQTRGLVFTRDGDHHLAELARSRRGAILLGAHLGSFEAMRLGGEEDRLQINIVGNFSNARMINGLLERLGGDRSTRVIHVATGDVGFVFSIQERIERGEMVAILGDRVAPGQDAATVEFFGRPARFPTGPYLLAALLGCPIYLTFGLFREPNRYELSCQPFAEQVVLPRRSRAEALRGYAQRFARELEVKARSAPDNWFNFYDFWREEPGP